MKYIGAHVSIEGGIFNAPTRAKNIGAKAFACFTKNQKRWFSKSYLPEDLDQFRANLKVSKILPQKILAHSGYLINLAHPDEKNRQQSILALIDEVRRCEQLGIEKIVFHPGSHLKVISEEIALDNISSSINAVILATNQVSLLVENTAGQGGNLGYQFEHLATLIEKIDNQKRIGVCIDTCHLFASGYDFTSLSTYEKTWDKFEKLVGFKYLKGLHLNDCKSDLGSRLDRHESLGKGKIGIKSFEYLMQDPRFDDLPLILETPDPLLWDVEIKLLYKMASDHKI